MRLCGVDVPLAPGPPLGPFHVFFSIHVKLVSRAVSLCPAAILSPIFSLQGPASPMNAPGLIGEASMRAPGLRRAFERG